MITRRFLLTTAALAGLALPVHAQEEPLTVGFIYVGPVGDGGWTYQHDLGRQAVEEQFGDAVETVYLESVPEGADAGRAMTQMALQGADLIFATSLGYADAVNNVAAQFPDVKFEHATGVRRDHPNVSTYDARFYEGRAVIGTIAGHLTESNKIGYIGSYPVPEVIQGINSAYLHAKKVNPEVEMVVGWANSWFDPAKEADIAQSMIEQGVDVIMQHTDSTAPQAAAQEAGNVYTFGQASDMASFAPTPRVSSIIDNWAPYYVERVQAVLDGTWESQGTWGGIGEGVVQIGEITEAVPPEVKAEAEALAASIASGEYHPFTGPINKADGTPWLAEGEVATDEQLHGMDFFVEGISAEIPS